MTSDLGNAFFEGVGAMLIWKSVLVLWRERKIRGVYWPAWLFWEQLGIRADEFDVKFLKSSILIDTSQANE